MAIKSETKTLQLTFVDVANKNVSYSIADPKADLKKRKCRYRCASNRRRANLCDRQRQPDRVKIQPDYYA